MPIALSILEGCARFASLRRTGSVRLLASTLARLASEIFLSSLPARLGADAVSSFRFLVSSFPTGRDESRPYLLPVAYIAYRLLPVCHLREISSRILFHRSMVFA